MPRRALVLMWLAWWALLTGFQAVAAARIQPQRPDHVLAWTATETGRRSNDDQPYLLEPFLNRQVAWDSEFYLSIATVGYDDPLVRSLPGMRGARALSLNYAFMPVYPLLMRGVAWPARALGLEPVAASALAGVVVSALGTLAGATALYHLARQAGADEAGGLRAAWYLLVFPSSLFLAQVYTEGLFVGLAFVCLALLGRQRWLPAAGLAVLAALTRPVGAALAAAIAVAWVQARPWRCARERPGGLWAAVGGGALAMAAPVLAYAAWRASPLGAAFDQVEARFFGRHVLALAASAKAWGAAWQSLGEGGPATTVYYGLEFGAVALAVGACLVWLRRQPAVAVFGLAAVLAAFTSGVPQSMLRYVLPAAPLFLAPARLGRHTAFDRAWTLGGTLLLGLLAYLFAHDLWVG